MMETAYSTDRDLLRAWLGGRETAFTELVERHAGLVFGVAMRQIGDPGIAEEVVQDVFTTLARKARALIFHPSVPAWLHVTSRNMARRAREKRSNHRKKLGRLEEETISSSANDLQGAQTPEIDSAITRLAVIEREAIMLRYFEDCDYSEIAARLDITEATARKRVSRGLQRLERLLDQNLGGGAALASLAIPVPPSLSSAIIHSTTGKAGAATLTGGVLTTTIGIVAMNTLTKTVLITTAGVGLSWFGLTNFTQRKQLERELSIATAAQPGDPASPVLIPRSTPEEMAELRSRLSAVQEERDQLAGDLAAMKEAVGNLEEDVVVNLGRVQDLGGDYGGLMVEALSISETLADSEAPDPEERQQILQQFMEKAQEITAAVPEIIGFEEQPGNMSKFLNSLYQNLIGLNEEDAAGIQPIFEKFYHGAIEKELTMAHAPKMNADAFDAWKVERDAYFAEGRANLLATLPEERQEVFEERIDKDSFWPRDMTVANLPLVFNPAGDVAAKVQRQIEALARGDKEGKKAN
ncbi:MAG: sigma-70 family RNA polymerase sigma factor [Verrucomicrobiota bacterium]